MDNVTVDINKFPQKVQDLLRRVGCVDANQNVEMDAGLDQGGLACYKQDKSGWQYPAVIVLGEGRKAYELEASPPRHQDSSDLEEYNDIVRYAKAGQEKDKQTCDAVMMTREMFIDYLAALNFQKIGSEDEIRSRRGRIQCAKLTVVRLWKDGKLDEPKKEVLKLKEE